VDFPGRHTAVITCSKKIKKRIPFVILSGNLMASVIRKVVYVKRAKSAALGLSCRGHSRVQYIEFSQETQANIALGNFAGRQDEGSCR
jgi:hypothetical protein